MHKAILIVVRVYHRPSTVCLMTLFQLFDRSKVPTFARKTRRWCVVTLTPTKLEMAPTGSHRRQAPAGRWKGQRAARNSIVSYGLRESSL